MSSKIKKYSGTKISSAELKEGKVPTIRFRPKVRYAWSAGTAMSRFLEELKKGKIAATRCDGCSRIMVPPRMFCEMCFKPIASWTNVKDTGVINTYSVSYISGDASRIEEPIVVAIIDLDGASKGMGILHKVRGSRPALEAESGNQDDGKIQPFSLVNRHNANSVALLLHETAFALRHPIFFHPVEQLDHLRKGPFPLQRPERAPEFLEVCQ